MKKPSGIKIGHRIFKIHYIDAAVRSKFTYGEIDFLPGDIYINERLIGTVLADSFQHEILHAFNHVHGITYQGGEDPEEDGTNSGSGSLTTLWADNPAVFKWWASLF